MNIRRDGGSADGRGREKDTSGALLEAGAVTPSPEEPDELYGWAAFRQGVRETFGEAFNFREIGKTPYGLKPVFLLILFGAVAGWSANIFSLAAPNIIKDLDLELIKLFNAFGILNLFLIFFTVWVGYMADRVNRKMILGAGSIVQGIFSFLTARSGSLWTLGASRAGAAAGQLAASVPATPLIADWYPVETWGRVVAMSRAFRAFAGAAAPLIVLWTIRATTTNPEHPNWRFPFLITAPAFILVGILIIVLLKEPIRGYMERIYLGVPEEVARTPEEPPSFGEAWRGIWSIKTLRRLFIAQIISTPAATLIAIYFPLFLFQVYHLDIEQRARLSFIVALPVIPAAIFAGGVIDVFRRRRPQRAIVWFGLVLLVSSLIFIPVAYKPPLWYLYVNGVFFFTATALFGPIVDVLLLSILPFHIRNMGIAVQILADIPGTIIYFFVVNTLIGRLGLSWGIIAPIPLLILGSIVTISAAGFFERDIRASQAAATASRQWLEAKLAGRGKLLVCRDVDVEYDGVQVLFGVDFDIDEGEIVAILGTNGAGKSTLLRAISGVQEASSGAIVFDGRDITHMPPHEVATRGVVHMPGGRGVFPGLTIRDNLLLGNWLVDPNEAAQRLDEVYEIFPVLKERASNRAGDLSGGEQQMLSLAQAFLGKPKLLMIDELTLGLGPAIVQELTGIIRRIHATGVTVILVEQSVNVALTLAKRAIFMEKGEVKFAGDTSDLLGRPDILRAVYVKGSGALTAASPVSALKTQRELRQYELRQARPIFEAQDVSKSFGGIKAVDKVSFTLKEGESLGIIGPNGAGKTTLFDLMSGYQTPDEGRIVLDGVDVTELRADERAKLRVVRRFQNARLFPSLTTYENLLVALHPKIEVRNMVLTVMQLPKVRQAERRLRLRAAALIDLLELGAYRDKFVKELSTGVRRIVDLACVLATEPKVLLLDEPSTGIAQAEAEGLAPLLRRVRFDTGCSMLVIEHDMSLISAISDELMAMHQGRVLVRGPANDVLNDENVIFSYLGGSDEMVRKSLQP